MDAYSSLAKKYEYLQGDYDYEKWSNYVIETLTPIENKRGVDVGAGTGILTRALKSAGFDVTGVDVSVEMLNEAIKLSDGKMDYYQMSAENLKGFSGLGFITAINDVVNYLSKSKAIKFFQKAYNSLELNGILTFDISSEYKLKNIVGNNTFTRIEDDFCYVWENQLVGEKVYMDLTIFSRIDNGNFVKEEENHLQYIHKKNYLKDELEKIGFTVKTFGEMGKRLSEKSERISFVCVKSK